MYRTIDNSNMTRQICFRISFQFPKLSTYNRVAGKTPCSILTKIKKEAEGRGNFGKRKSHFSPLNLSQSSSRFSQNSAIVARLGLIRGGAVEAR
jgi:hypothetical protein